MADFINRVTMHFDELTKSHKDVANYFLYHLDKVAVSTLEDLAGLVGVSTTTVIRFARQLEYGGFTELQKDAQNIVLNKEMDLNQESDSDGGQQGDTDELFRESWERDLRNIENTMKGLKKADLDTAVELLQNSKNLYLFGMRMAFTLSYYSYASWGRLKRNIRLIQMTGMEYPEEMISMRKGDVCVVFAFPRYVASMLRILNWMKGKGVKVILITTSTFAGAREFADLVLPCRVKTTSYQNSYAAPICLINYFTMALASRNREEAIELLKDSEELLGEDFYIGN